MSKLFDHPQVLAGGLRTARLSRADLTAHMIADCIAARWTTKPVPKLIFTANGHSVALAAISAAFAQMLDAADLIHADGQPVVTATRWMTDTPVPERSATTDLIHDAARAASPHGLRFFLLGGPENVNAKCARILQTLYPRLILAGRHHGHFLQNDEASICDAINRCHADVVWVGLGVPHEQAFCLRNKDRLSAGWLVTCGGCFHYITGDYKRAPQWMQDCGLEWLHRLWREPRRLGPRYALTNPLAAFKLLTATRAVTASDAF